MTIVPNRNKGRIKIISDGNAFDTKIIDEYTNTELTNVYKVVWSCDARNGLAKAVIYCLDVPVETIGRLVHAIREPKL